MLRSNTHTLTLFRCYGVSLYSCVEIWQSKPVKANMYISFSFCLYTCAQITHTTKLFFFAEFAKKGNTLH